MLPIPPPEAIDRLREFQRAVGQALHRSWQGTNPNAVSRSSAADTIYQIDTVVEPLLEEFCRDWGKTTPLVLVAEGIAAEGQPEGLKVFPEGASQEEALIRLMIDPIDGTRGIMYDKRAAWSLAGVAPNKRNATRLSDIEVAVMTELATSKMGFTDVLWATRGGGAQAERIDLASGGREPLTIAPSAAATLDHGFASISNFFPGTKVLASELMEYLVGHLIGPADVGRATVFDDQYISTGGQFYELIVGHDRFNADLRPTFYRIQGQPQGLCCHPYDCATMLIAQEAGVILTDDRGRPLDGPFDVTSGISWIGYANARLRSQIEPLMLRFIDERAQPIR